MFVGLCEIIFLFGEEDYCNWKNVLATFLQLDLVKLDIQKNGNEKDIELQEMAEEIQNLMKKWLELRINQDNKEKRRN